MILFFGTRLYGKVDQVPGVFYVATRFFYLQFVPLVPVGSFLIIEGTENDGNFSGVSLGLSGKSVLFAYLRLIFLLGGIIAGIVGVVVLIEALDQKASWLDAAFWLVMFPIFLVSWWFSYSWSRAGEARALRLAELAGIPPEAIVEAFAPSPHPRVAQEQVDQPAQYPEVMPLHEDERERGQNG